MSGSTAVANDLPIIINGLSSSRNWKRETGEHVNCNEGRQTQVSVPVSKGFASLEVSRYEFHTLTAGGNRSHSSSRARGREVRR